MDLEEIDFVTIPEYLKLYNNSVCSLLSTYFKILLFKFLLAKKPETGTGARLNTTKLVSAYVTLFFPFIRLLLLHFK